MNKADFIKAVGQKLTAQGMTANDAAISRHLSAILETIKDEVKVPGGEVALVGFGTFSARDVPARDYRNPQNGKTISKPATRVAKVKLSKNFLD